jgi:hypothetical protein
MPPVPTSSFKLPSGEDVPIVFVRLGDGRLVPRRPDELIQRPAPPGWKPDAANPK